MGLSVLWLSSACTLISVGNTVKKDFAPALSRGDIPKLMKYSTPELGALFSHFSGEEIRQLMRWGATPPPAKAGKLNSRGNAGVGASAAPKISGSLDSFSSSKNRARLRVKSGSVKYTFVMHRIRDRWRVHDILIQRPGGDWSFQDILGLFLAAKDLLVEARRGQAASQRMTPELAAALSPVLQRMPAWGLLKKREPEKEKDSPGQELLVFVNLAFEKDEALATFLVAGLPVDFKLSRKGGHWALRDAVLRVPDRPALGLLSLARAFGPALVVLGDMRYVPGPSPYAFEHVRSLLDAKLEGQLVPVLSPLWSSAVPLLASRLRPQAEPKDPVAPSKSQPGAKATLGGLLQRLTWKTTGTDLEFRLEQGAWAVTTRWTQAGRLARIAVWTGAEEIQPRHLAGFAPFSRWWDAIVTGAWSDPATWLREGVRLLASPWSGVAALLPRTLTLFPGPLPVSRLRSLTLPGTTAAGVGPDPVSLPADSVTESGGRHPAVRLEGFTFTQQRVTLEISTLGRRWIWSWRWEDELWRLNGVKPAGGPDLLPYVMLLPPAWRALEGLSTRSAELFTGALGPDLQKKLGPGLKELFSTHGKWIETLLRETLEVLQLTLASPQVRRNPAPGPKIPAAAPSLPVLDPVGRTLTLGGRRLAFAPLPDGAWGLLLPEPPPVKSRTEPVDHALAIVELWPTLAGLYLGLATTDPVALSRFSSPDFSRKVWKKMSAGQFTRMLDRLDVEVPLISGRDLVGRLLPDLVPAEPVSATEKAAGVFDRLGKISGVKTGGALSRLARKAEAAAAGPSVRILGTLVRSDRRYPFAEIWLLIDNKRIDLNFSWDSHRRMFVLDEIRVTTKVLGRDMTFGLKDSLQNFL